MMDQDTTNEDVSEDSEDDLPTSKSQAISKKRKMLPISSEDEDSDNNTAKHGQCPSPHIVFESPVATTGKKPQPGQT